MTESQKNLESSALSKHQPVLLQEVLEYLDPQPGQIIVDGTLGFGGHTIEFAKAVGTKGKVLGIEWDEQVLEQTTQMLDALGRPQIKAIHGNYANMDTLIEEPVDAVLLDVGYNSWHVDESGKGFSFQGEEPLDMRYDTSQGEPAAAIVNSYTEDDLYQVIKEYGEERYARPIAKAIVTQRKQEKILTTGQLVEVIRSAMPGKLSAAGRQGRMQKIHFATRTFQALRIETNHELDNIRLGLDAAVKILKPGGRIAIISFHSLEDRIVKHFFKDSEENLEVITKKPVTASVEEQRHNPRSRSAKLRVARKR